MYRYRGIVLAEKCVSLIDLERLTKLLQLQRLGVSLWKVACREHHDGSVTFQNKESRRFSTHHQLPLE
jgi:hypothetical protein